MPRAPRTKCWRRALNVLAQRSTTSRRCIRPQPNLGMATSCGMPHMCTQGARRKAPSRSRKGRVGLRRACTTSTGRSAHRSARSLASQCRTAMELIGKDRHMHRQAKREHHRPRASLPDEPTFAGSSWRSRRNMWPNRSRRSLDLASSSTHAPGSLFLCASPSSSILPMATNRYRSPSAHSALSFSLSPCLPFPLVRSHTHLRTWSCHFACLGPCHV